MPDRCSRSAISQTANVLQNWTTIAVATSRTRALTNVTTRDSTRPSSTLPMVTKMSVGTTRHPETAPVTVAPTARRYTRSALASLKRLSPSRITSSRLGGRSWRSTAVAAAASGGATMAPSAIAAAHGICGTRARATRATTTTVSATAPIARLATDRQFARRSRGEASKAASSKTGAADPHVRDQRGADFRARSVAWIGAGNGSRTATSAPASIRTAHRQLPCRVDEKAQRPGALCTAGEIDEVARHCRRIALEHDLEASNLQLFRHHRFERVSESQAPLRQRGAQRAVVAHHAPVNRHAPGPAPALQLPGVERTGGLRAEGDAVVSQKVPGSLGRPAAREVGGRAHDDEAKR